MGALDAAFSWSEILFSSLLSACSSVFDPLSFAAGMSLEAPQLGCECSCLKLVWIPFLRYLFPVFSFISLMPFIPSHTIPLNLSPFSLDVHLKMFLLQVTAVNINSFASMYKCSASEQLSSS